MKSKWGLVAGMLLAVVSVSVWAADSAKPDLKCPVSGAPAKEANAKEYAGKEVYFCCMNCPKAFNAEKHATKANLQLAQTKQIVQVGCPFSGGPVNPDTLVEVEGVEVGFCCPNCQGKFKAADNQIELAFASLKKAFTTQTKCPVSGEAIDPTVSAEHKGSKVYFCCNGCVEGFTKDPAKYESKLPKKE